MHFFERILRAIQKRPLFFILLGIISVISIVSIKPQFALLGWDNYSSYFNIPDTLFKNFFDPWREFRGLGVPSDSESTDVPRQLFFLITSIIFPQNILDQVYFVLSMVIGVIATYALFSKIISPYESLKKYQDLGGFIAGLFYLFNLHTLSVFYFPITPYITRYFAIPVMLLAFYTVFTEKHLSWKKYLAIMAAVFLCAPSYVIGTVFVTIVMAAGIFALFQSTLKRIIFVFSVFFLLNSFWLLNFFNYTIEKSDIIRLAPTFISANETQLNKPKDFYKPTAQLILAPNFFETEVTNTQINDSSFLHALAHVYDTFPYFPIFAIFPVLYIAGSLIILRYFREYKRLLWIPFIVFIYTFLSLKEFSPLGFVYQFLNAFIPYFEVIFRFGDTKFHPYIAFGGALASAFAIIYIVSLISEYKKKEWMQTAYGSIAVIVVLTFFAFRWYFTGEFLGFFMYNKIPPAYNEITEIINNDPEEFRVAHLPYDDYVYWRSYSWGYVGSSFLNYMIDKPLFDKTFEPASMENAYVMQRIQDLLHNTQSLSDPDLKNRSEEFYTLMSQLGVKYIILDETVSATQFPRGINLWGKFNFSEAQRVLQNLENNQYIKKTYVGNVQIQDYMDLYEKVFDLDPQTAEVVKKMEPEEIVLYELADRAPKAEFISSATAIDPDYEHELLIGTRNPQNHTIKKNDSYLIYPFLRKNATLQSQEGSLKLTMNTIPDGVYRFEESTVQENKSYLVEVKGYSTSQELVIAPYLHYYPSINGEEFILKFEELTLPLDEVEESLNDTNLRLQINNSIIPVPQLSSNEQTIGYTVVDGETVTIKVLERDTIHEVPLESVQFTDQKNCYNDALTGYEGSIQVENGKFNVTGKNGSTCFWRDLVNVVDATTSHIELEVELDGSSEDLDPEYIDKYDFSSKPVLTNSLLNLEKPNTIEICIKQNNIDDCFNTHKLFNIPSERTTLRIPSITEVTNIPDMLIFFALKNTQYQKQELALHRFLIHSYKPISEERYPLTGPFSIASTFEVGDATLNVTVPYNLSPRSYSYRNDRDMLLTSNNPCGEDTTYRTFRMQDNRFISYLEDCQNRVFTQLPFSSNSFYLWSVDYNLASGQYPKMVVEDGFYKYISEYMSLYQGYPEVEGFKAFQYPELPFQRILKPVQSLPMRNTYTYIYPHPEYNDQKQKDFSIEQFSENEGMMLIDRFDVVELPNYWQNLRIVPADREVNTVYTTAEITNYNSLLPSLKRISARVENPAGTEVLLKFNESYDRQWGVYPNIVAAIFGWSNAVEHSQCDGYANCFVLPADAIGEDKSLYLYYWPQTLSFIGWAITILTATWIYRKTKKKEVQ